MTHHSLLGILCILIVAQLHFTFATNPIVSMFNNNGKQEPCDFGQLYALDTCHTFPNETLCSLTKDCTESSDDACELQTYENECYACNYLYAGYIKGSCGPKQNFTEIETYFFGNPDFLDCIPVGSLKCNSNYTNPVCGLSENCPIYPCTMKTYDNPCFACDANPAGYLPFPCDPKHTKPVPPLSYSDQLYMNVTENSKFTPCYAPMPTGKDAEIPACGLSPYCPIKPCFLKTYANASDACNNGTYYYLKPCNELPPDVLISS